MSHCIKPDLVKLWVLRRCFSYTVRQTLTYVLRRRKAHYPPISTIIATRQTVTGFNLLLSARI